MVKKERTVMKRFMFSFVYAYKGLRYIITHEQNIKVHFFIGIIVLFLGIMFHFSAIEFAILLLSIGAVIGAEMINTVIEVSIDLVTQEYHELAEIAKDVAAGTVMFMSIIAIIIGIFLFIPHIHI